MSQIARTSWTRTWESPPPHKWRSGRERYHLRQYYRAFHDTRQLPPHYDSSQLEALRRNLSQIFDAVPRILSPLDVGRILVDVCIIIPLTTSLCTVVYKIVAATFFVITTPWTNHDRQLIWSLASNHIIDCGITGDRAAGSVAHYSRRNHFYNTVGASSTGPLQHIRSEKIKNHPIWHPTPSKAISEVTKQASQRTHRWGAHVSFIRVAFFY